MFARCATDLLKKAQTELDNTHHSEFNAAHDFAILQQSLDDQQTQDNKALEKGKSENTEFAAALAAEKKQIWSVKNLAEELKAWAYATQAVQDQTAGVKDQTYSPLQSKAELEGFEVVTMERKAYPEGTLCRAEELVTNLMNRLQTKAMSEVSHKSYCDEEADEASARQGHKSYCDEEADEALQGKNERLDQPRGTIKPL